VLITTVHSINIHDIFFTFYVFALRHPIVSAKGLCFRLSRCSISPFIRPSVCSSVYLSGQIGYCYHDLS